ncbi:hypothetical protein [Pseudomonas fontis]|uniref:Uncharacterized protein n=1 Tax=Pseudomonas fontis TaxID=2942633 RepID=A0ABT5NL78_9PSED|nr:hypothetical protein [Pseudomonas fontis]MDD0975372.1 hypothetical protein [Pseudomonas fontis]MDD0989266.1 hypothetical protein [Pseudomonas fontis]
MKAWEITFVDQNGERMSLPYACEHKPSVEQAARLIRTRLYPVMDELDLTDFQDRVSSPTAEWLKKESGVEITAINEKP